MNTFAFMRSGAESSAPNARGLSLPTSEAVAGRPAATAKDWLAARFPRVLVEQAVNVRETRLLSRGCRYSDCAPANKLASFDVDSVSRHARGPSRRYGVGPGRRLV